MGVMKTLFHEIYGSYYRVVASILAKAVNGNLTDAQLSDIVREQAFAESVLTIPAALQSETWPLLTADRKTPLHGAPDMPLTTLEKRWLKSLLQDPRIRLFSPSTEGLEDVEPLYAPDVFVYYDQYDNGDPYMDETYIAFFHTILTALREKRKLSILYRGGRGRYHEKTCIPHKLEYSLKDDKFRLVVSTPGSTYPINVARITACKLLEPYEPSESMPQKAKTETLVLELTDERNALERTMLEFSHFEKETERLQENRYRITLTYDRPDETELLIRVLSYGPVLRVLSPKSFIHNLTERLERQEILRVQPKN